MDSAGKQADTSAMVGDIADNRIACATGAVTLDEAVPS